MTPPIGWPSPSPAWAYFLDIDGTLVELAGSPAQVLIDPALRRVMARLHERTGGAVALITGRSLAEVNRLFPMGSIAVAAQHGMERRSAAGRISRPTRSTRLTNARRELAALAARHPGLLLEDKGLSLALHYRGAPRLASYVHRVARAVAAPLGPTYCVQRGKRVIEIRLAGADKGTAIVAFLAEPCFRGRTPVFLGDDRTDEHGFAMVNRLGGYSVKIGPGRTVAQWRLPTVASVRDWLDRGYPLPVRTRVPR